MKHLYCFDAYVEVMSKIERNAQTCQSVTKFANLDTFNKKKSFNSKLPSVYSSSIGTL